MKETVSFFPVFHEGDRLLLPPVFDLFFFLKLVVLFLFPLVYLLACLLGTTAWMLWEMCFVCIAA